MAERSLPPAVGETVALDLSGGIPCHSCGLRFYMGEAEDGTPVVLHAVPHCAAFDAIEDTDDAVALSRLCRAQQGDLRR